MSDGMLVVLLGMLVTGFVCALYLRQIETEIPPETMCTADMDEARPFQSKCLFNGGTVRYENPAAFAAGTDKTLRIECKPTN